MAKLRLAHAADLSSHKRARTRELIEAAGAELRYPPPYSPDLNPIEMIFAKIKQLLRSLASRTRQAMWQAMQSLLDQISPGDAANCFRHCGESRSRLIAAPAGAWRTCACSGSYATREHVFPDAAGTELTPGGAFTPAASR